MNETKIFQQKIKELHQELNNKLPEQARDLGLQFFKSRFRAQGWLDKSFEPWKPRSPKSKRNKGRAILIDTGRLRNSIRGEVKGDTVVFGTDVPYAKIHNEGGTIHHPGGERKMAFKSYSKGKFAGKTLFHKNNQAATFGKKVTVSGYDIRMPKRQFIGESEHLNKLIIRKIETTIKNVFK